MNETKRIKILNSWEFRRRRRRWRWKFSENFTERQPQQKRTIEWSIGHLLHRGVRNIFISPNNHSDSRGPNKSFRSYEISSVFALNKHLVISFDTIKIVDIIRFVRQRFLVVMVLKWWRWDVSIALVYVRMCHESYLSKLLFSGDHIILCS